MIRALLDGRKTMTRRIIPHRAAFKTYFLQNTADEIRRMKAEPLTLRDDHPERDACLEYLRTHSLYGSAGDRLWVKETWRTVSQFDELDPTTIGKNCQEAGWERPWAPIEYVADGARDNWDDHFDGQGAGKTRVSIHMPRWASRITLEVTSIRVERLQCISGADVLAEGVTVTRDPSESKEEWLSASLPAAFLDLWDSINGKRPGCSWDANPWVWVVAFRKLDAIANEVTPRLAGEGPTP